MKKAVLISIIGVLAFTFTGCESELITRKSDSSSEKEVSKAELDKKNQDEKETDKEETDKDVADKEVADKDNEDVADDIEDNGANKESSDVLIQKFIESETKIKVNDNYVGIFSDDICGAEFTLNELSETITFDDGFEIKEISYGKLDMARDEGDWYSIKLYCESDTDSCPLTNYAIVQVLDGDIILHCCVQDYYRGFGEIYNNGIASHGGSVGAGSYVMTYYLPDGRGNYEMALSVTGCWPGWDFYEYTSDTEYTSDLLVNTFMARYAEEADASQNDDMCMVQLLIDGNYYYYPEYANEETGLLIDSICDELDITFYTMLEADEIINSKISKVGYDLDGLYNSDLVEYTYSISVEN